MCYVFMCMLCFLCVYVIFDNGFIFILFFTIAAYCGMTYCNMIIVVSHSMV